MSTKNIEAVLKWVGQGDAIEPLEAAFEELEALRNMAKTLAIAQTAEIRACGMTNAAGLLEAIAKEES